MFGLQIMEHELKEPPLNVLERPGGGICLQCPGQGLGKVLLKRIQSFLLLLGRQVGVDVHGHREIGITKEVLSRLHVRPSVINHSGAVWGSTICRSQILIMESVPSQRLHSGFASKPIALSSSASGRSGRLMSGTWAKTSDSVNRRQWRRRHYPDIERDESRPQSILNHSQNACVCYYS